MNQLILTLLLSATAAWFGYRRAHLSLRAMLPVLGLAAMWWIVRCALLILTPSDVSLSENYVGGFGFPQIGVELGVACTWLFLCLLAGIGIAHLIARRTD